MSLEELTAQVNALPSDRLSIIHEVAHTLHREIGAGGEIKRCLQSFDAHFLKGGSASEDICVIGCTSEVKHSIYASEAFTSLEGIANVVELVTEGGGELLEKRASIDNAIDARCIRRISYCQRP